MFNLFKINEIFSDKNNNKKKKKNIFASKDNKKKNHDKAIRIEKIFKGETNSKANNKKNHDKKSKIDKIFKSDKKTKLSEKIKLVEKSKLSKNEKLDEKTKVPDAKPIIFIPGISGSELFTIDEKYISDIERKTGMISAANEEHAKRLWLPQGYDAKELNEDLKITNEAYGLQEGDFRGLKVFDRHVGPGAANAVLLNALLIKFPDRPIYQFSYDWRKSNTLTMKKLDAFIKTIRKKGKVDIVAHSMGGLVAAHYIREHGGRVDKFISLCTPYEGAPHAYNQMASGNIFGGIKDVILENLFGIEKEVVQGYDGLVELYPTAKMLCAYPYQKILNKENFEKILSKRHKDYNDLLTKLHEAGASEDFEPREIQSRMKSYLGANRFERYLKKAKNYRRHRSFSSCINLLYRPRTMFIVGEGIDTQVSGYYSVDEANETIIKEMVTKEGDGLVPMFSACMGQRLDQMPEEIREKFQKIKSTHMGMLMDLRAMDAMCKFLSED